MRSKYNTEDVEDLYSDCFAKTSYRCAALVEMQCKHGGKCSFYKPKELYEKQVKVLSDYYTPKHRPWVKVFGWRVKVFVLYIV